MGRSRRGGLLLVFNAITVENVINKGASLPRFDYWLVAGHDWRSKENNGENKSFHDSFFGKKNNKH
jgi:hypothetical protein